MSVVSPTTFYDSKHRKKQREYYDEGGRFHNDEGPAITMWDEDGAIVSEEYYNHGVLHRTNGPASILVQWDGTILEHWFIDGRAVPNPSAHMMCAYHAFKQKERSHA